MPSYKSLDQERYLHMAMNQGKMKPSTVKQYDDASKGMSLPEKVPMKNPMAPALPGIPNPLEAHALPGMPPAPMGPQAPKNPLAAAASPKIKSTQALRDIFRKKFGTKPGMEPMGG